MPVVHYIEFAADDGFYALVFGRLGHKLERAEHIAVVGDGQGFHAVGFGFFEERRDGGCAVEQGVLGMAVEVGELWHVWNTDCGMRIAEFAEGAR